VPRPAPRPAHHRNQARRFPLPDSPPNSLGSGVTNTASSFGATPSTSSGGQGGFIQADSATNTLIITANEATYRNIRAVIDQLDVRRVQVYSNPLIVEVNSGKEAEFGIQWMGLSGNGDANTVSG